MKYFSNWTINQTMHELSVCLDIIAQVEKIAQSNHASRVELIHLQIGPLSGVEIPLLESAFTIAQAGTIAEKAQLSVQKMPILIQCKLCQKESQASLNNLTCRECGSWKTQILSGDEMILQQIELNIDP